MNAAKLARAQVKIDVIVSFYEDQGRKGQPSEAEEGKRLRSKLGGTATGFHPPERCQ